MLRNFIKLLMEIKLFEMIMIMILFLGKKFENLLIMKYFKLIERYKKNNGTDTCVISTQI